MEVVKAMPAENYAIVSHPKFGEFSLYFIVCFMPFLWFSAPVIQRFLIPSITFVFFMLDDGFWFCKPARVGFRISPKSQVFLGL